MPASTLDGKLLCASGSAYDVVTDQAPLPLDPSDVSLSGAGFLQPPVGLVGGPDTIDACLVGEIAEGLVIAFRGTLPLNLLQIPTLRDWLSDFQAIAIPTPEFPGLIHQGFYGAWSVLFPKVMAELKPKLAATPTRSVYVTGHSKGGAIAPLIAWSLLQAGIKAEKVVTFAAAKPADAGFSEKYDAAGIVHARYEYDNDIVPHFPLSDGGFLDILSALPVIGEQFKFVGERFDYRPVGTLFYIEENDQIIPDNATLRSKRDLGLALEILQHGISGFVAEHSISCGSGYMTAIAPVGVCPPPGT
jgi:hypothetical protein